MVKPHTEDPAALAGGTRANSQSYVLSRDEPGSPGGETKNGVSFYTFTPGI